MDSATAAMSKTNNIHKWLVNNKNVKKNIWEIGCCDYKGSFGCVWTANYEKDKFKSIIRVM